MADTGLKVAAHLEEDLHWIVRALDAWASRDSYQMGGGLAEKRVLAYDAHGHGISPIPTESSCPPFRASWIPYNI